MDIYKDNVLEAIETEPLRFGDWVNPCFDKLTREYEVCTTCALGAIISNAAVPNKNGKYNMRPETNSLFHSAELNKVNYIRSMARNLTKKGGSYLPGLLRGGTTLPKSWPNALSYVWESIGAGSRFKIDIEEARAHMLDWVEENVPDDEVLFTI